MVEKEEQSRDDSTLELKESFIKRTMPPAWIYWKPLWIAGRGRERRESGSGHPGHHHLICFSCMFS
jgi:hypothetical protein